MKNNLDRLRDRLEKIGIDIDLVSNAPWIYLTRVNGNKVEQKDWTANYGYVIAYYAMLREYDDTSVWNSNPIKLHDLRETFNIVRKYR